MPRCVDHKVNRSRPSWSTCWNPVSTKSTKISWAWWHEPVVPATREAKAEKLLEHRRWRLQWAKIAPLHSSLCDRERLHLKKKRERERKKKARQSKSLENLQPDNVIKKKNLSSGMKFKPAAEICLNNREPSVNCQDNGKNVSRACQGMSWQPLPL